MTMTLIGLYLRNSNMYVLDMKEIILFLHHKCGGSFIILLRNRTRFMLLVESSW